MPGKANSHSKEFRPSYGPWALVAGASEGLGAAYAEALARRGLDLVLVARRLELLQQLAARLTAQYDISVRLLPIDLSQPEAVNQIARETQSVELGLLVYNAAFSAVGPFFEHPLDDHLKEVDTNVRPVLGLVDTFGRRMLAAGHGGIILMTSLRAFQGSLNLQRYQSFQYRAGRRAVGGMAPERGGCAGLHRGCHPHTQLPGQLPKAYRQYLGRHPGARGSGGRSAGRPGTPSDRHSRPA